MLFRSRFWAAPAVALFSALISHAAVPLGDALEATNLVWSTSGLPPWAGQTVITHDGVDAAESGAIADGVAGSLSTTVNGPGTLSFWWRASSETNNDRLIFFMGGVEQARISGEVGWNSRSFSIPGGAQLLTWTYSKNASVAAGQDRGWVDQVLFTPGCSYLLSTTNRMHGYGAATNSVTVSTDATCAWVVSNTNSWITILSGASGNGTGTVTYAVAANTNLVAGRTGTVMIAGIPFTIQQSAQPCLYTISPTTRTHGPAAAANSISVMASASCGWSVVNTSSWVTLTGVTNGNGNGTVTYAVALNTTPVWRTSYVAIADQKFALLQRLASCIWELSPTNRVHGYGGSTGLVTVALIAGGTCTWQVENTNSWITITTAPSGTGSGSFGYVVEPNPTSVMRQGTFKVWDEVFTVLQQPTPCSYSLSPVSINTDGDSATNVVAITTSGGCPWTVTNLNNWISVSPMSGAGSGNLTVVINANSGNVGRTGVVSVANQTFTVRQDSGVCTYKLSTTNRTHGYSAASNAVTLTTLSSCAWTVLNTNSWISILSATNGFGSAPISYTLPANNGINDRVGVVLIGGQTFAITQRGVGCAISVSPASRSHGYGATSNALSITAALGCAWDVTNTNSWLTIVGSTNGVGNGVVGYLVAANPTAASRSGYITVEEGSILITQAGAPCSFALTPTSFTHSPLQETGTVSFTSLVGCNWTVVTTNPWVTILSATNGTGSGSVVYRVDSNSSSNARSGVITIGTENFSVIQNTLSCNYKISPTNRTHGVSAATNTITVTVSNLCPWSVINTNPWITILSGASGNGSGTVTYAVDANSLSQTARTGMIFIDGQVCAITQLGVSCSYSISPDTRAHGYGPATDSFDVNTGSTCGWAVSNTNSWVTVGASANPQGSGTVNYILTENTSLSDRIAVLNIEDKTFTITQRAATCAISLSPDSRNHGNGAATNSVSISTGAGCGWTVQNSNAWVIVLSNSSGFGPGSMTYAVSSNGSFATRSGNLLIGDQVFAITQSGFQCNYKLSPTNRPHGFGMTTNSISVTAAPGCGWSVVNTNDWLAILSGANGSGNGSFTYTILPNYGTTTRTAVVMVVDQIVTIQQSASTGGFVFESVIPGVSGGLTLKLNGGPPGIWAIESSGDLTTWSKVADITNTTGRAEYNVPPGAPSPRFYRARLE